MTHYTTRFEASPVADAPAPHVAVQILSVLVYGGFAIAASIVAIVHFWPAGIALGALLGWRGHFLPHRAGPAVGAMHELRPEAPERKTGNASFDAYREQMLNRLEDEQTAFEGFLDRLRDAKDKVEFDHFLDDRAARARREWDASNA